MTAKNVNVTVKMSRNDCGDGYDADDLEVLATFFTIAGKAVRCGAHGLVYCCEPKASRKTKLLAEIRVETPAIEVATEVPTQIGEMARNGRNFVYRIEQQANPHFTCETCSLTTCPCHRSAQGLAEWTWESREQASV